MTTTTTPPQPRPAALLILGAGILMLLLHAQAHAHTPGERIAAEARRHIGTREATGRNDGPMVERFLAHVGLPAGHPWCAAFVCYVIHHAGIDPAPRTAWSPALFPPERTVYRRGRDRRRGWLPGDVFGIYYPEKGRIAHVGIIEDGPQGQWVYTIEGNTNPAGAREGQGVHRKRRSVRQVHRVARYN